MSAPAPSDCSVISSHGVSKLAVSISSVLHVAVLFESLQEQAALKVMTLGRQSLSYEIMCSL